MTLKEKKRRKAKEAVRSTPEEDPEFQIAPMIDVLLVLLVFFMSISSTEVLQSVQGIDLPVAADGKDPGESDGQGQTILNVAWIAGTGKITVDELVYPTPESLEPLLKAKVASTPGTRVLIRADKTTRYAFIKDIMKIVAAVGIGNVTFSTIDKEKTTGPG